MDVLHVVSVVSNICEYDIRWKLMNEFIERMNSTKNIVLYIVEMAYNDQKFHITDNLSYINKSNKILQLRSNHVLWHKENMINLAVKELFPDDWKYMAWIDGDIQFCNPDWPLSAINKLQTCDIIQLFDTCDDLNKDGTIMHEHISFGFQWEKSEKMRRALKNKIIELWHPGYAWACTREFYFNVGIYDKGIVGHGDRIIATAIAQNGELIYNNKLNLANDDIKKYQQKFVDIRCGHIPGKIVHYFHGSKKNRQYHTRYIILSTYDFSPDKIEYDDKGILSFSNKASSEFIISMLEYFKKRNEDE